MTDEVAIRERDAQDWRVLESAFDGAASELTPLPLVSMSDRHTLLTLLDAERAKVRAALDVDVGIYPKSSPGDRTPWQDGWNAACIAILDAIEDALSPESSTPSRAALNPERSTP